MKTTMLRFVTACLCAGFACLIAFEPAPSRAQYFAVPQSPEMALRALRSEVGSFRGATRTAPNYVRDGYSNLWLRFQALRTAFENYVAVLSPDQVSRAANELAELRCGLDMIQEVFSDSSGDQSNPIAFRRMCGVLDRAVSYWGAEVDRVSRRLGVR